MNYKVGDKVRLKTWESMEKEYGLRSDGAIALSPCVNTIDMKRHCGELTEIVRIDDDAYRITADGGMWYWTDKMIEGPAPVYKPGDRVKIREWDDLVKEYGKDSRGFMCNPGATFVDTMRKYCGKILTIARETPKGNFTMTQSANWNFSPAVFTKVEPEKEVFVAYRNGQEVIGLHKINGEVVKQTTAKCHPDDKFDFMVGAKLTMERMKEEDQSVDEEIKVGDTVKVTDNGESYSTYYTWFVENKLTDIGLRYAYNSEVKNGTIGSVLAIHPHIHNPYCNLYAIEDRNRTVYVINRRGIQKITK